MTGRVPTRHDGPVPAETPAPNAAPTSAPDVAYVDLERELRVLLRRAGAAAAAMARRIHPGLEASAYPLLAHIADHPGVRGSDLAAHFGVGRATISRQLSRLHTLGLVARARPWHVAAAALGWCWAVEALQATGLAAVVNDAVPPAAWLLGSTFAARDLVCYLVGVALACLLDTWAGARSATPRRPGRSG